jgi:predicted alpha-1,2-mannosidase
MDKFPKYYLMLLLSVFIAYSGEGNDSTENFTKFVNPFIGTAFRGNTYPGATVPFGMVQLSPDAYVTGDRASGYRYDAKSIIGFSHTHLSGTGLGEMLDLLIMPTNGELQLNPGKEHNPDTGYRSRFVHENESASPGYYSVVLEDYKIKSELTTTERVGFHRYTFPQSDNIHIILDLAHRFFNAGISSEILQSNIQIVNDSLITGMRRIMGVAQNRYFYFALKLSKPFQSYGISIDNQLTQNKNEGSGKNIKCYLNYSTKDNEQIQIKVGISAVSIEGAIKNLNQELPHWDFDQVRREAESRWNDELSRIEAEFTNVNVKTTFYTAMYHTMLAPVHYSDVDGSYRGSDFLIHKSEDFNNYHIFSLWETFRAVHPLFTVIQQERVKDFIKSIIAIREESKSLPVWHLAGNETNSRSGSHAIPVIVDAYFKGYNNFDAQDLYSKIKKNEQIEINTAMFKQSDLIMLDQMDQTVSKTLFRKNGYVPFDISNHSVSKTLEYSYDDWCLAQMAKSLGHDADYQSFKNSSDSYKNSFDSATGFMRGKSTDGKWREPFKPYTIINHRQQGDYAGASAMQNSWFVPHDIPGLITLMGGKDRFTENLDFFFNLKNQSKILAEDVAGFVGLYAQGNEPDHHAAYLYNYVNQPWKTQAKIRYILAKVYSNRPEGLVGNDDCGQLSAWYIFSALGFYPVNPCGGIYVFGSPWVKQATIDLDNGNTFQISTQNQSYKNQYIQSVILNGQPYDNLWITHEDIMKGGTLLFIMGEKENKNWGTEGAEIPSIISPLLNEDEK